MSNYHVRELGESHRPQLLALLRQDPANNIFLIGNLATFGVRGRGISFWGAFRQADLVGVAMLHGESASLYASERACLGQLQPKISIAQNLSGELGLMEDVLSLIPAKRIVWSANEFFCRLNARDFQPYTGECVRPAVPADLELLTDLYAQGESVSQVSRRHVADDVERHLASARYQVLQIDNQILCAAGVAETEDMAMIVSVLTAPAARNRGYASAVVSSLCADLLARGKTPHLFYREDNEAAGHVYQRLGFTPIGRWKLARLSPIL